MAGNNNVTDMSFENSIQITEVLLAHKCTYRAGESNNAYSDGRKFSGFVCPVSGTAIYQLSNGEQFTVASGEIVYLPEMSRYIVKGGDKGFTHYTVNFLLSAAGNDPRPALSSLLGDTPVKVATDNFDAFTAVFSKTVSVFGTNMPGATLLLKAQILQLIHMFFVQALRTKTANNEYEALVKAKEYIEEHYSGSISAKELSKLCSMSETNLRRKFREYTGQPPLDYQLGLRIRKARELLLERKYNVSEVARAVGFEDVNYFSRLFKKRVGVSPQTYEKMY